MTKKLQVEGFLEGTIPYVKKIENIPFVFPTQTYGNTDFAALRIKTEGTATIYFTTQGIYTILTSDEGFIQEYHFTIENKKEMFSEDGCINVKEIRKNYRTTFSFKIHFNFTDKEEIKETLEQIQPFYDGEFYLSFEENIPFIISKPKKKPKFFITILSLYLLKKTFCLLLRRKNI